MTQSSALPLPPKDYNIEYMNRLIRQLELTLRRMNAIQPLTVGSDLSGQIAGHPVSGLTIVNVPTSPANLPIGSVWCDTSNANVLKIVS